MRTEVGILLKERAPIYQSHFGGETMMSTSLTQGLEIVAIVSVMAVVVSPILCWILSDRTGVVSPGLSES